MRSPSPIGSTLHDEARAEQMPKLSISAFLRASLEEQRAREMRRQTQDVQNTTSEEYGLGVAHHDKNLENHNSSNMISTSHVSESNIKKITVSK